MGCNSSNQVENVSNPTSIKPKVDPVTNDNLNTQVLDLENSEVAQKEQNEQKENVKLTAQNDSVAVIGELGEQKAQNDNVNVIAEPEEHQSQNDNVDVIAEAEEQIEGQANIN